MLCCQRYLYVGHQSPSGIDFHRMRRRASEAARNPPVVLIAIVKGFGCRPDAIDGPVQRPASESLRRTNPREAASGLPSMGILSGGGLARNDFSRIAESGTLPMIAHWPPLPHLAA